MELKDLWSYTCALPVVDGVNLKQGLGTYLMYDIKNLERQRGVFEDVLVYKTMAIIRKKNTLIEELELNLNVFHQVYGACMALPCQEIGE